MKKRILSLSLVLLMVTNFCCGCVNIFVENPSDEETESTVSTKETKSTISILPTPKEKLYASTSKIIITTQATSTEISSDSLNSAKSLADTFNVILQDRTIQAPIKKAYPGVEYTCELKAVNNTAVYSIVVTSKEKESLKEICEMITNEFCAEIPAIVGNISVKIVKTASEPTEVTD